MFLSLIEKNKILNYQFLNNHPENNDSEKCMGYFLIPTPFIVTESVLELIWAF